MTPLHTIGQLLRDAAIATPLPLVRVLFLAVPILLMVWVLRLPVSETTRAGAPGELRTNLKLWACLALLIQVLVYSVF